MFVSYEYFYVENYGWTMEKVVTLNIEQKKQITKLRQMIKSKDKVVKAKNLEIENKNKEIVELQ